MRMAMAATGLLAWAGCSQLFGLDPPARAFDAAIAIDLDASPDVTLPVQDVVRRLDIVGSLVSGAPHAEFPLLVSLNETWLRDVPHGGDVARADGFDVYFSSDSAGSMRLAHEVESYDPTTGALVTWVKLPTLAETTSLFLHYGSSAITTSQENHAGVWSASYQLVLHSGGTDSTAKNTIVATNVSVTPGRFGVGAAFNGTTSAVAAGSAATIDNIFSGGGSLDAWIKPATFGEASFGRVVDKGTNSGWAFFIYDMNGQHTLAFAHAAAQGTGEWTSTQGAISTGAWQHVAVVYNKDSSQNVPQLFVNGASVALVNVALPSGMMLSDAFADTTIGNAADGTRTFDGVLDEIRMSSLARSAGWIATQYRNQVDPASFYTVSDPL